MSVCNHIAGLEKKYVENGHVLDNIPYNFIINVSMSDSDTDQEDEDADGSRISPSSSDSD